MEEYFVLLVRFVTCLSAVIGAVIIMVRADDNAAARRLACALGFLVVLFNERIGYYVYLLFGSVLETLLVSTSLVFVILFTIALLLTIAALPILAAVRWVVR
ncbi:MAG: hypothetical protein LUH42_02905 [Oscillospiraceae bacterium]|nr:hypothetical protein [Oscillospiraceae bacterium]